MSYLIFYDPPDPILASGTKEGVELGGSKILLSIDKNHNFHNEGIIYTEMSWAEFYHEEGLEDQIDTFTTKKFDSIREDPETLALRIIECLRNIMEKKRLFYGIADFECDAFLNQNTIIPGLKLDKELINKLMMAHKKIRDAALFPKLIKDTKGIKKINMSIQGLNKKKLIFPGVDLADYADKLRLAKGFATGIIATSKNAANFFMMNDFIVFKEDEIPEFYIDHDCITIIEIGIQRNVLFPISWFRIDIGIRSLETLENWDLIKENKELLAVLKEYEDYITKLIVKKYKPMASPQEIGGNLEDEFYQMTPQERKKALADMEEALRILNEKLED
ncbi:MAG: hypothetical protein ACTSUN_09940 [Promethearchaeota archaeon]